MTDLTILPSEEPEEINPSTVIERQMAITRQRRDRLVETLGDYYEELMKDFTSGEHTEKGNRKRPDDLDDVDKITKLLMKALGDNDKVDLTRLRIEADKGINDDNIVAAKARTDALLRQLGRSTVHPGATLEENVIEGEVVHTVTQEERDKRLGLDRLDRFKDIEFDPGVLIKGRVEENSDAFYQRVGVLTDVASSVVEGSSSQEE